MQQLNLAKKTLENRKNKDMLLNLFFPKIKLLVGNSEITDVKELKNIHINVLKKYQNESFV